MSTEDRPPPVTITDTRLEMFFDSDAPDGPGWFAKVSRDDGHDLVSFTSLTPAQSEAIAIAFGDCAGSDRPLAAVAEVNELSVTLRRNQEVRRQLREGGVLP